MKRLVKTIYRGIKIWYQWDDVHIGQRIALGKYEPYVTELFLEVLKQVQDDMVVVDVGANIGYYSLLAAKSGAKVWAFEPEEKSFSILEKNMEDNGFGDVKIFRKAVGNKRGRAGILRSETNYGNNRVSKKGEAVEMVRLDEVIKEKVDVIKIDVEGWEGEVIKGAKEIIKKYKPVIFLEYGIYEKDERVIRFLKKVYGKVWGIDEYVQIYCANIKKGTMAVGLPSGWSQMKDIRIKKLLKTVYNCLWQK